MPRHREAAGVEFQHEIGFDFGQPFNLAQHSTGIVMLRCVMKACKFAVQTCTALLPPPHPRERPAIDTATEHVQTDSC